MLAIDEAEKKRGLDPIQAPAQALESCPVPVIAVINGLAMGGALELAMACDFRLAESEARFGMPPARLGLVYSAEGLLRFLRQVPPSIVKRLFLLGETIDAELAKDYRIIDEMFPTEDLEAKAWKWARAIADHAPMAVEGMLEILRMLVRPDPLSEQDQAVVERWRQATIQSKDLQEGIEAFREKRTPQFQGE